MNAASKHNIMTDATTPSSTGASPNGEKRAHVIVLGNEKGGSGKTTTSLHLIVALLRLGFKVGTVDIDSRQRSLSRYLENRRNTITKSGTPLPVPHHIVLQKSPFDSAEEAKADERERFQQALRKILFTNDFVVIDSPGNDTYLSRLAHSYANTIITPINDSFVDLDVLASVDPDTYKIIRPSIYSEMVWEQKLARAKRDGVSIEWIVMRNRLSNLDARNKRSMAKVTSDLSRRIGFRLAPGFSERVIFREMFLHGLTVLDVIDEKTAVNATMSHIAARQEVRDLLRMLKIPEIDRRLNNTRTPSKDEDTNPKPSTRASADTSTEKPDAAPEAQTPPSHTPPGQSETAAKDDASADKAEQSEPNTPDAARTVAAAS